MSRIKRYIFLLCFINMLNTCFGIPKFHKYGVKDTLYLKTGNNGEESTKSLKQLIQSETGRSSLKFNTNTSCWMSLNSKDHLITMERIDDKYKKERERYQHSLGDSFSHDMLDILLKSRGIATRELFRSKGVTDKIPAGLNLGGLYMLSMPESILFFHRIKLRNNTYFRVNSLDINLVNMAVTIQLSLNDLHLVGAYGRVLIDKEPGVLYYTPSSGEVEFLLKDAIFNAEGRLRLIKDRLKIEVIESKITTGDKLMSYVSDKSASYFRPRNIDVILERIKTDLQNWLKDYFNDFFMFHPLNKPPTKRFQKAENQRINALNDYADYAIQAIIHEIQEINATAIQIPSYTLNGSNGLVIKLHDGTLRGLDTIYRRSVATGKTDGQLRKVNTVIGFSSLKVIYKYDAELPNGFSVHNGAIILTSDDLTGHLAISLVKCPEAVDINIDSIEQIKPGLLIVEGSGNRLIASYRHVLEHHITAIMANMLYHVITMIRNFTGCIPNIIILNTASNKIRCDQNNIKSNQITKTTSKQPKNISESTNKSLESSLIPVKQNSNEESENPNEAKNNESDNNSVEKSVAEHEKEKSNELSLSNSDGENTESEKELETKSSNNTNYWLTKNESMEIEIPNKEEPGKIQRVKVHRLEEYKIIDK